MAAEEKSEGSDPRILVFSTNTISDPGIDFAGSSHLHYSPSVLVLSLPCSSGIKPDWILRAVNAGFNGVFVAADGSDCIYTRDCTERTAALTERAQKLLEEHGHDARRVKMAAICSVCAESFVSHLENFKELLRGLGPVRKDKYNDV